MKIIFLSLTALMFTAAGTHATQNVLEMLKKEDRTHTDRFPDWAVPKKGGDQPQVADRGVVVHYGDKVADSMHPDAFKKKKKPVADRGVVRYGDKVADSAHPDALKRK